MSGHSHADDLGHHVDHRVRRILWSAVGVCAVFVVIGLIALWPTPQSDRTDPLGLIGDPVRANVNSVTIVPCSFDPMLGCKEIEFTPAEGELRGTRQVFEQPLGSPIESGDPILIDISELADGSPQFIFYDFQRSTPMLLLLILFVVTIVTFGRWRGVGALAGLVMSLVVIIGFALPALLEGSDAVMVALVTAGFIAFVALFLAHGVNLSTAVALLSTLISLAVTGLLAVLFVSASRFTGLDETVGFLGALNTTIDPRGLLLAGIVIGSLGVLDDVTVTQVSAVWELKRAAPQAEFTELYQRALRIGRDHISSTVNTLFLAYAGAALPLLLLFSEAGQGIGSVATREVVAVEIVRAIVGSIGLVMSVPISTALAARALAGPLDDQGEDPTAPSGARPIDGDEMTVT